MATNTPPNDSQQAMPNVWQLRAKHNPYLHNIFVLLGIDPDAGDAAFTRQCDRIGGQLRARRKVVVNGCEVGETDVARARGLTANGIAYVAERLLAHTSHQLNPEAFAEIVGEIDSLPFESPESLLPLRIRSLSFLTRLLPELADVAAGEPHPLSREQLAELVRPTAEPERVYDL